jgi:hypothetical protein
VYIPEKGYPGEDKVSSTDERYIKTKIVRVTNNANQEAVVTLNSNDDFKINPSGSITIPKDGGHIDLTVTFGQTEGIPYTGDDSPPKSRNASLALDIKGSILTLAGVSKRAAAELSITIGLPSAPSCARPRPATTAGRQSSWAS